MVTHSEIEEVRKALREIDQLTNLLDVPEKPKNPLSPSHSYVAVKIRKIIQKLLLVGFGDVSKMREALEAVRDAHFYYEVDDEDCEGFEVEADDGTGRPLICVVEDALETPARVCDEFGTDNVAAYLAYKDLCAKSETKESAADAIAWLLSIDQERANHGSK